MINYKPIVLIILDGFGIAPANQYNAVSLAQKPFFDSIIQTYPTTLLQASSEAVGLPWGEVGNSEVGHLTIGSGILRYQNLPRINKSISTGQFFKIPQLQELIKRHKNNNKKLHIIGMIGNGGIHSYQNHLEAVVNFAKNTGIKNVYLHLFLDGRDTAQDGGKNFMTDTLNFIKVAGVGKVASISGRYWGMDRNKNWDRIKKSYDAMVYGKSETKSTDPIQAIEESYDKKIFDERLEPTVIVDKSGKPTATIGEGDSVVFFNFRSDRARQLTEALTEYDFKEFEKKKFQDLHMITFTQYREGLPVSVMFPLEPIKNPIGKIFSDLNMRQLHIAETEKYAHITFFINGRIETPFAGEDRILIPSPAVTSYDQKPEMSAVAIKNNVVRALKEEKYDFIIINFANPDMVGHTGNLPACIKGIEVVDQCISEIIPLVTKKGGVSFVVSDHGNAEEMFNSIRGQIDKEHNIYPVPFIAISDKLSGQKNPYLKGRDLSILTPSGVLSDVAPTILETVGLRKGSDMTGTNLF